MAKQCDDCGTDIGGWLFERGRDPERVKTCTGRARHKICSVCHGGWRQTCPICKEPFYEN